MRKADGCAIRGKTRLKMVKMARGGMIPGGVNTGGPERAAMPTRGSKPATTGLAQGAAMSGRAMPTTGRRMKCGGKAKK